MTTSRRLSRAVACVVMATLVASSVAGCHNRYVEFSAGEFDAPPCVDGLDEVAVETLDEIAKGCDRAGMVLVFPDGYKTDVSGAGNNDGSSDDLREWYMVMNFGKPGVFAASRYCDTGVVTMWGPQGLIDRVTEGFGKDPIGDGSCESTS